MVIDRVSGVVRWANRFTGPLSVAGATVLVIVGFLMATNALAGLAHYAPAGGGAWASAWE
jgi:hypothetical protein